MATVGAYQMMFGSVIDDDRCRDFEDFVVIPAEPDMTEDFVELKPEAPSKAIPPLPTVNATVVRGYGQLIDDYVTVPEPASTLKIAQQSTLGTRGFLIEDYVDDDDEDECERKPAISYYNNDGTRFGLYNPECAIKVVAN